jgi:hypothetical protein
MTDLLELIILEDVGIWLLLIASLLAIAVVPRLFGLRLLSALLFAQMTLAFNAVTIVAGLHIGAIDARLAAHFFANEFAFLALISLSYRWVLSHRQGIRAALGRFIDSPALPWLTIFIGLVGIFNLVVVPSDGESRIAYMTAWWYSMLKPFVLLATPIAYLAGVAMISRRGKRRQALLLLGVAIAANVLTGSKASFVFAIVTAALALHDLSGPHVQLLNAADRWRLALLAVPLAVGALGRLEVSPADVAARFMLFGEATILVYFAEEPTEACKDVSTLASMHRGVARLLGDESANDVDTLFGFALTKLYLGVNTMTGPNGRLSAYFLCNFPGKKLALGWLMVLVYLGLLLTVFRRARRRPLLLAIVFPYVVTSLGSASQDFNLIMADITIASALMLVTIRLLPARRQHAVG